MVPASVLTGVVVGLALVAATYGSLQGCEAIRGARTCGGAGLPLLMVIFALGVVLGAVLLRVLAHTRSAASTSFLAVAFVTVVSLLFLLSALDDWPALLIVPVLSAIGYAGSSWVTTTYLETEPKP
ncbi:MAG: hypothetical protein QM572_05325 [Nocardioides sp.]|uniref:hypothetical protein n=1 Tax=Nocardioides sp. TaxID=35761 RepID=UPI0039E61181